MSTPPDASALIVAVEAAGRFALVESAEQRGSEPPCHCHHWEDELLYVLEGELAVLVGDAWLPASAGKAVVVPRGTPHTFAVLTERARLLLLFSPAGFENFYRDLGAAAAWTAGATEQVERWVATAARYGCEVMGPHPGRPCLPPAE